MRTVRTVHKERRKTRNRFYGCSIIQLDRRRTTHSCSEARPSASSIKSCLPLTECKIEFYFATELFRVYFSFLSKKRGRGKKKRRKRNVTFPRKCNFVSNAYLQIWGREIRGKEKKRYEARVWIWWKHRGFQCWLTTSVATMGADRGAGSVNGFDKIEL